MAYQANRRGNAKDMDEERNIQNNANNIRNAADVAIASKNPYGVAAGGAIKVADKLTKGKSSEAAGKVLHNVAKKTPMGRQLQNKSNKLSESGLSDKAGKIAALKNKSGANNTPNQMKKNNNENNELKLGGEGNNSLPSSLPNETNKTTSNVRRSSFTRKSSLNNDDSKNKEKDGALDGMFSGDAAKKIAIIALPAFLVLFLILLVTTVAQASFSKHGDSLGMTFAAGEEFEEYSDESYESGDPKQVAFYDRVNEVAAEYLANGTQIDVIKVIAVYNVLDSYDAGIDYDDMNKNAIKEIVEAMISDGVYNEETFKTNLATKIFPKYIPGKDKEDYEFMADEVIEHVEEYNELVGREEDEYLTCSSAGSCEYDIKGFYIKNKGNISKKMTVSNLYVRLMQCGTGDGHDYGGTFGKPLGGEELVPFEKYILGVAYQEIGPTAPSEAIKAQMVAARSYILARHVDMGGWRTLKKEGDKWVLQAAACTQDQVYCDPDKGCSSKDGQWSQVHSGSGHGTTLKGPLAQNSPLRTHASQTSGEVLVNNKGYIVYTGYTSTEQNKMSSLAKNGLNYKQILLQVYNQGDRNYGATDISKGSCSTVASTNCATSTGEFARWKQFGAPWSNIQMGSSGSNIGQIGCLVTSISMLIAKSKVPTTVNPFNPGTFVQKLNKNGGFDSGGNFIWGSVTSAAPKFKYQDKLDVSGLSRTDKLNTLKRLISQPNVYVVAEVKGNTGQHWVAIDSVNGDTINMLDPGSNATNMWKQYKWYNTSTFAYFRVS